MGIFDFIDEVFENYHYVLDPDGSHRPARDMAEFAEFMQDEKNSRIASDYVEDVHVSTIFLGLDHSYGLGGPPLLYETMILGGGGVLDGYQKRTYTKEAALIEHAHALKEAQVAHRTKTIVGPVFSVGVDPATGKDKTVFSVLVDGKVIAKLSNIKVSGLRPWFTEPNYGRKKGDAS